LKGCGNKLTAISAQPIAFCRLLGKHTNRKALEGRSKKLKARGCKLESIFQRWLLVYVEVGSDSSFFFGNFKTSNLELSCLINFYCKNINRKS
jgi:hypothetical protein